MTEVPEAQEQTYQSDAAEVRQRSLRSPSWPARCHQCRTPKGYRQLHPDLHENNRGPALLSRSVGSHPPDLAAIAVRVSPAGWTSSQDPTRKPQQSSTSAWAFLESTVETTYSPLTPRLLPSDSSTSLRQDRAAASPPSSLGRAAGGRPLAGLGLSSPLTCFGHSKRTSRA